MLGWSLDLFDLFILLYVAPVVGALFFPSSEFIWDAMIPIGGSWKQPMLCSMPLLDSRRCGWTEAT